MKPIKLSMTAFGPFAGQEMIDFREIAKEPVFLICGPTGAGKTTIFDAISYALFGDASGEERKPDAMRSDFAQADILTEVIFVFEVKGKEYRICRQPRQFRRKKSGEGLTEVPAKAELWYTDERGEPLVFTRAAEIAEKIKEIVGLGSEQFKQIMMLPQGEFRKLLTADSKEREAILREIFDAEQYLRFQLRLKEESDTLEKEIKEIRTLQNQWIFQLQAEESDQLGSLAELLEREEIDRQELFNAIEKQNADDEALAQEEKRNAEQIGVQINEQKEIFFHRQQENQKLQELQKVRQKMTELNALAGEINVKEQTVEQIEHAVSLKPYAENCKKLEVRIQFLKKEMAEAVEKAEQVGKEKLTIEQKYRMSRSLERRKIEEQADQQIQELRQQIPLLKTLDKLKGDYSRLLEEVKKRKADYQRILAEQKDLEENIRKERQIILETDDLEEKRVQLEKKQERYQKIKEIYRRYCLQRTEHLQLEKIEEKLEEDLMLAEQIYQRALEAARQNHISALRAELKEGDSCPVCGSSYHFMEREWEPAEEVINIQAAEQTREQYRRNREQFQQKKTEIITKERTWLEQLLQETKMADISDVESYIAQAEKEDAEDVKRLKKYADSLQRRRLAVEHMQQRQKDLELCAERKEIANTEYDEKRSQLDRIIGEGQSLKETISPKYRETNVEEISGLENQLVDLEREKNGRQAKAEALEERYRHIITLEAESNARYQNLERQMAEQKQQYMEEKEDFLSRQRQAGFMEEAFWRKAIQQELLKPALVEEIKAYREDALKTSDLEKRLLTEVKIEMAHDLEKLEETIAVLEMKKDHSTALAVKRLARRNENDRIGQRIREMEKMRERQKRKFAEISSFAKVANGENSKRLTFERYVLAAFLEDVLQMANYRLEKMTGRYSLKRKEEVTHRGRQSGLEIEVFDAFTGKTRSVQTLSGGEGFKAALAMALGLSEVVSSYAGGIELDMLMIDEGFGTLDPESLDTAIDCIMDLQAKGKLIGIISHVSELKERIPAKLEVRQTPQGSYTKYGISSI